MQKLKQIRTRIPRVRRWGLIGLAILILTVPLGSAESRSNNAAFVDENFTQCPNIPSRLITRDERRFSVPLAGNTVDIHEYHDCQKLIVRGGPELAVFGPLVGIWARAGLRDLQVTDLGKPRPIAQLYNFSRQEPPQMPYTPLGIKPGYNCLYFWRDANGRPRAGMLPRLDDRICEDPIDPSTAGLTMLHVRTTTFGMRPDDIPSAARWDWDGASRTQYIGIYCAGEWCEIGENGFTPSPVATPGDFPQHRTRRVKGWYDEQFLTVNDPASQLLRPDMNLLARIYPHPRLDSFTLDDFRCADPCRDEADWVPVASVLLSRPNQAYKDKIGFGFDDDSPNRMFVRFKVLTQDQQADTVWEAKIESPDGGLRIHRGFPRIPHEASAGHAPGTARWRWITNDDGTWVACAAGCCNVDPPEGPGG